MKLVMIEQRMRAGVVALLAVTFLMIGGCTVLYKGTGDVLVSYAEDQAVPYILTTNDPEMACAMSEAFAPFFFSFGTVTNPPDQLAILFYMMAGSCSEAKAWEEELRYLRAMKAKNVIEAQDARISQKRYLAKAASRQLLGYQKLVSVYGEPGETCPKLKSDDDEFYYLIGLIDGVLAIFNDISAEGLADVPLDIANKISRAAGCLDMERWWGVPGAIQAAVWFTLPSSITNDKIDPTATLNKAVEIGLKQGVRVVQVFEAQVYLGQGNVEKAKEVIRQHVKVTERVPSNPSVVALDGVAKMQLMAISDRLWTEATGKRTPVGAFGTFWDDAKSESALDIDDLL